MLRNTHLGFPRSFLSTAFPTSARRPPSVTSGANCNSTSSSFLQLIARQRSSASPTEGSLIRVRFRAVARVDVSRHSDCRDQK